MEQFNAWAARVIGVVRTVLVLVLLAVIAMTAARWFGFRVPITVNPTEIAYLAGAFWLVTR